MSHLIDELQRRILILDGAMGTMIQSYGLGEAEYRGERFKDHPCDLKGNNDLLSLTQPRIIGDIHRAYLEAGADFPASNPYNPPSSPPAYFPFYEPLYYLISAGALAPRAAVDEYTAKT